MARLIPCLLVVVLVSACSDFPDLDAAISDRARTADYPEILPLTALLASVPARQPGAGVGALPARAAALRARARTLRGARLIDTATRARMRAALARYN